MTCRRTLCSPYGITLIADNQPTHRALRGAIFGARMNKVNLSEFLNANEKLIRDAVLFGTMNEDSKKSTNEIFLEFIGRKGLKLEKQIELDEARTI